MVTPTQLVLVMLVTCQVPLVGQWYYEQRKDAMTDTVDWHIYTFARPLAARGSFTTLDWVCDSSGLSVFVRLGEYLGGDVASVQYRFDSDAAAPPRSWVVVQELVGLPPDLVAAFTSRARTASLLLIRATAEDGESVTRTFEMDGSRRVEREVQLRASYLDKRGRLSRSDSLLWEFSRSKHDSLTFAMALDRLPCKH